MTDRRSPEYGCIDLTSSRPETIRVAFWNLQNLFDIEPSPVASELGFTAIRGWGRRSFEAKVTNLADIIRRMFDGDGPGLIGLAEVENERVVQHLVEVVGRDDYAFVTANDSRCTATGTALIYSKEDFDEESVQVHSHLVHLKFPTCDILEVRLRTRANQSDLSVLVNHWPSRREENSDAFRQTVASHCASVIDRHLKLNRRDYVELPDTEISRQQLHRHWNGNVLLMGSFNDPPWARSLHHILNAGYSLRAAQQPVPFSRDALPSWRSYASYRPELFNPAWGLLARPDLGTCVDVTDQRRICVYDQLIFSGGLAAGKSGLQIVTDAQRIPVMNCLAASTLTDELGHPIPFACSNQSGFSDRLPVGLTLQVVPRRHVSATASDMAGQLEPQFSDDDGTTHG